MRTFIFLQWISLLGAILTIPALSQAQTAKDYLKSGNQKFYAQKYTEAMTDFKKAIALEPTYSKAYQNLGNVMYLLQDFDGALTSFNKAIKYDNRSAESFISRGTLFLVQRKFDAAEEDITKALEINPKHPVAIELHGSVLFATGQKDDACTTWKDAAKLGNEIARKKLAKHCGIDMPAPEFVAAAPLLRGEPEKTTKKEETKQKEKLPENVDALITMGDHKMEVRKYKEAMDLFNKAIKKDGNACKAFFGRGMAKFALHDHKGACKDWKKAVALGCEEAQEFIEHGCME